MELSVDELIAEMRNQFPKEFTICVQAVQIRKLQQGLAPAEESDGGADA